MAPTVAKKCIRKQSKHKETVVATTERRVSNSYH